MTTTTAQARTRRRLASLALAGALVGMASVTGVVLEPAAAHDELLASSPANAEVLDAAPDAVTLQFSDDILTIGAVVLVVDDEDTSWVSGETELDGPSVSATLAPDMPDGAYEVRWRVVSSDGHPIAGVVPFTVGEASAGDTAGDESAATSAPPVVSGPGGSEVGDETDAGSADAGPTTASTESSDSPFRLLLIGTSGAVAAVALLFLTTWRRRRRHPSDPATHSA